MWIRIFNKQYLINQPSKSSQLQLSLNHSRMEGSKTLETHPLFYQSLTLEYTLLEVGENQTVFCIDEDLATAGFAEKQLVDFPCILCANCIAVVPFVFLGAEVVIANLPRTIVLVFLQLPKNFSCAKLEDDARQFFFIRSLLGSHKHSQNVEEMFGVHVELYFPPFRGGAPIQPFVIYDLLRVIQRLKYLTAELQVLVYQVQTSERFFIPFLFVFAQNQINISCSLFIDQITQGTKKRFTILELNHQQL